MARIQPSLTKAESDLVDKVAELTQTKRTEVIKNSFLSPHRSLVRSRSMGDRSHN